MSNAAPKGYNTVTTYLTVRGVLDVLDFVKKAFGAEITEKHMNDDGSVMHAEVKIGDTRIMLGEAAHRWNAMPAMLYVYVPDCDAAYKKALNAGARSVREPTDQHYGDRSGGVKDSAGNQWWIASPIAQKPSARKKPQSKKKAAPKAKAATKAKAKPAKATAKKPKKPTLKKKPAKAAKRKKR